MAMTSGMYSSINDTWTTPKKFFQTLNEEFNFTLDAAALSGSALCPLWYGLDHPQENWRDSFQRNWQDDAQGNIWLNPPYGKTIKEWMAKADAESKLGATIICLVPSRTDTAWWHEHVIHHEVRFIRGRLKFGQAKNAAPFPSALVVMKPL